MIKKIIKQLSRLGKCLICSFTIVGSLCFWTLYLGEREKYSMITLVWSLYMVAFILQIINKIINKEDKGEE